MTNTYTLTHTCTSKYYLHKYALLCFNTNSKQWGCGKSLRNQNKNIRHQQQQPTETKFPYKSSKRKRREIVRVSIFWFLICENLHKICRKWKYNAATVEEKAFAPEITLNLNWNTWIMFFFFYFYNILIIIYLFKNNF